MNGALNLKIDPNIYSEIEEKGAARVIVKMKVDYGSGKKGKGASSDDFYVTGNFFFFLLDE